MRTKDGFEMRNPVYLPGFWPKQNVYDLVKWELCEPRIVSRLDGQQEIICEYCYVVAQLIWDSEEEEFELRSIGMRLPESHPSEEAMEMVCEFAREKEAKLRGRREMS